MASLVAIRAPTACPTWSLKYGPVQFSGASTTPSSEMNRPAAICRIGLLPFLGAGGEELGQQGGDGLGFDHVVLAGQGAVRRVGQRGRERARAAGHPGRTLGARRDQRRDLDRGPLGGGERGALLVLVHDRDVVREGGRH